MNKNIEIEIKECINNASKTISDILKYINEKEVIKNYIKQSMNEVFTILAKKYSYDKEELLLFYKNNVSGYELDEEPTNISIKAIDMKTLINIAKISRIEGLLPYYIAKIISLAFYLLEYNNNEKEFQSCIKENGMKKTIEKYTGLNYEVELIQLIYDNYKEILDKGFIVEDEDKIKIIKKAYEKGHYYEKVYKGCGQCTLAAIFEVTGKKDENIFRASNGFSAGMSLYGDGVCGGYSGGILSLGMFAGRRLEHFGEDREEKQLCYKMTEQLRKRFIETYDTVICANVHKSIFGRSYCLRNGEDKVLFEEVGAHTLDKCTTVVATAAQWVTEILIEYGFIDIK